MYAVVLKLSFGTLDVDVLIFCDPHHRIRKQYERKKKLLKNSRSYSQLQHLLLMGHRRFEMRSIYSWRSPPLASLLRMNPK